MKKYSLILILAMVLLAACTPPSTPDNILVPAPTEPPSETPVVIPTETVALSEDGCPTATADLKLMVNTEGGFCMLYPAEFTWNNSELIVLNPYQGPGDIPGDAWLDVEISDAGGQTAAQIVDAELAALGEGFNITRTELTIDGKPAILVDGLPAFDSARFVYIVNNDRLYRFDFLPWFPNDGTTPLEKLYQTVVDTLHFLPTSGAASAPENGCPTETAELKLLVNTEEGYCLLYPADDVFVPLRFIVINTARKTADTPGAAWVDIMLESADGRTAAQAADAKIAEWGAGFNITRQAMLVDGLPAVVVDGLPGTDSNRVVFIVSNDRLYKFHFLPWFPNPNETTRLEELYKTILDTLHFLPPTMPLSPGAQQ